MSTASISETLSDLWRSWPAREVVVFRSRTSTDSTDYDIGTTAAPMAKRRVLTAKELAASNGRYIGTDMVWHIPYDALPDYVVPKAYDQIIDSAQPSVDENIENIETTWTVLEMNRQVLGTRYKLICRNMVLAYELYQTGTFYDHTHAASAGGGRVKTWAAVAAGTNIPCRVQPMSGEMYDALGKDGERALYTIIVEEIPTGVTVDSRFVCGGVTYQLKSWRNRERLDLLPEFDAEVVPV